MSWFPIESLCRRCGSIIKHKSVWMHMTSSLQMESFQLSSRVNESLSCNVSMLVYMYVLTLASHFSRILLISHLDFVSQWWPKFNLRLSQITPSKTHLSSLTTASLQHCYVSFLVWSWNASILCVVRQAFSRMVSSPEPTHESRNPHYRLSKYGSRFLDP